MTARSKQQSLFEQAPSYDSSSRIHKTVRITPDADGETWQLFVDAQYAMIADIP